MNLSILSGGVTASEVDPSSRVSISKLITKADTEGVDSCVEFMASRLLSPPSSSHQQHKDQWMRRHSVDPINPIIDVSQRQSKLENRMGKFLDLVASRSHLEQSPKSPLLSVEESSFIALPVEENEVTYLEENPEGVAEELECVEGGVNDRVENGVDDRVENGTSENRLSNQHVGESTLSENPADKAMNRHIDESARPIESKQPVVESTQPLELAPVQPAEPSHTESYPPTTHTHSTQPTSRSTQPVTRPPPPPPPPRRSQPTARPAAKRFCALPPIDLSGVQSVVRRQRQAPPPRDLHFVEFVGPRRVVAGAVIHPRYLEGVDAQGRVVVPAIQVRSLPAYSLRAKKVKHNDAAMEEEEPSIERRLLFTEHEDDGAVVARALRGSQTTEQLERQLDASLFHSPLSSNKQCTVLLVINQSSPDSFRPFPDSQTTSTRHIG